MPKKHPFDPLIEASSTACGEQSLKTAVEGFALTHGFELFAYLHLRAKRSFAVSNYPTEWQALYFDRSYNRIDPVITAAKRGMRAFRWSIDRDRPGITHDLRRFYDEAAKYEIRSGFSIPVRTGFGEFAILTLASSSSVSLSDGKYMDAVQAAAAVAFIHARFVQQGRPGGASAPVALSPRELMCLRWSAEGKSMHDIALVAGLKYSTVRFYLDTAKTKLDVVTLPQATALAIKLMLI